MAEGNYAGSGIQGATSGAAAGSAAGPWGAAIGGGIGLIGGLLSAKSAEDAANEQAAAQQAALDYQKQLYAQTQQNLAPYMQTGAEANQRLSRLVSGMQQPGFDYQQQPFSFDKNSDPGAIYLMQQAAQAINGSALAKGGIGGGLAKSLSTEIGNEANTAFQGAFGRHMATSQMLNDHAMQKYGRNLGWQNQLLDRNAQLAGAGQNAAAGMGGFSQAQGAYGANLLAGMGGTRAAGTLGANNALVGGLNSLGANLAQGVGSYLGSQSSQSTNPWVTGKYDQPDWMSTFNNTSSNAME